MRARRRRSTSTGSCAITICARAPEHGRSVGQSRAQGRAQARQPRDRARYPQAAGNRSADARAHRDQGGRGAAGAAGARDAARRNLWAGRGRAAARSPQRCARRSSRSISSSTSTTASACAVRAPALFRSTRRRWNIHGVEEQAVYDTIGALVGGVKIGYSQRGGGAEADRHHAWRCRARALSPDERILSTPLPAGGTARQGANVELGDVVKVTRERALLSDLPPQRPLRRNGAAPRSPAASRRRSTACSRSRTRSPSRTGARTGRRTIKYHGQPLDDSQADPAVGRRMGGHLCHLPRHGRGLHGGDARHLSAGRRAVRLVQAAARHPRARAVDADRHHARASGCSAPPSPRPR